MNALSLESVELGVATAATHIEGGDVGTIWHRWAASGAAVDHSTPAVGCDHWNRIADDTALMASLGIRHYRLGLEWARIEPAPNTFDEAAIARYREELEGLRAAGIAPLVTLHHFNDPIWFSDAGGFLGADATATFLRYVKRAVLEFGDLVNEWITVNEPDVFALNGYYRGSWPPGRKSLRDYLRVQAGFAHAHVKAYELIHAMHPDARVGFAQHLRVFDPLDVRNPLDHASATAVAHAFQGAGTMAACRGRFMLPFVQPSDVRPGKYHDFLGVNYYSRSMMHGTTEHVAPRVPVTDLGWEIYPEGLTRVLTEYHERFGGPIYITENGAADADDSFRCRFIYDHLAEVVRSGLPVERYYHWTFMDNWEWHEGQTTRFGLVANDFRTQERTVRESARFYADVIANRGVTEEAYQRWVAPQMYRTNS